MRTCEGCGCSIEHKRSHAVVCGIRCYMRARRPPRDRRRPRAAEACEICGASLESKNAKARVCSERCYRKARWQRESAARRRSPGCPPELAQAIVDLIQEDPGALALWGKLMQGAENP